jgi:glutamine phosphoribosylpyrophosphate amidotransferase
MELGMIGLGRMGAGLVRRLMADGHRCVVYDVDPRAVKELEAAGAVATHSLEEMRDIIGADSLAFLSIDGMYRAMGEPGRDPANPKFSDHCFTGAYPTHLTDQTQSEPQPRQLSLLAEAS